jgi:hypothetical protein
MGPGEKAIDRSLAVNMFLQQQVCHYLLDNGKVNTFPHHQTSKPLLGKE